MDPETRKIIDECREMLKDEVAAVCTDGNPCHLRDMCKDAAIGVMRTPPFDTASMCSIATATIVALECWVDHALREEGERKTPEWKVQVLQLMQADKQKQSLDN